MNYHQIKGTDFHNFPETPEVMKALFWMGNNYMEYLAEKFTSELRKQDALTEILAIKCEADPQFETKTSGLTGKVSELNVLFVVQLLLKHSSGAHWRLHGTSRHSLLDPGTEQAKITFEFDIERSERLE
jgi:hypothetical protein